MKYALIGCGRVSPKHMRAAMENGLSIVAICDIDAQKTQSLIDDVCPSLVNTIRQYTDYKAMIQENKIDLISIATISGSHAEIALYCIDQGINIIIEKPIAMSMDDANLIIQKSEEKHVKVSACHQNRFSLTVQKTRKALEAGRFGKLSHGSIQIRWIRDEQYYKQASWRGKWETDGGALMNQCIHGIDLLRWMMGSEIEELSGFTRQQFHHYIEAEDVGMAVVKFKNGAIGTIEGSVNTYPKDLEESLSIFGENGTVVLGGNAANHIDTWNFRNHEQEDDEIIGFEESIKDVYGNGHTRLFADVIDAINRDRQPYVNAEAGRDALETVLAIYKSQKTGEPVKFPLSHFSSSDMIGEF